jgi:hypothetical protein
MFCGTLNRSAMQGIIHPLTHTSNWFTAGQAAISSLYRVYAGCYRSLKGVPPILRNALMPCISNERCTSESFWTGTSDVFYATTLSVDKVTQRQWQMNDWVSSTARILLTAEYRCPRRKTCHSTTINPKGTGEVSQLTVFLLHASHLFCITELSEKHINYVLFL